MSTSGYVWASFAAPLVGCVLITLLADRVPRRVAGLVACAAMLVSFVLGVLAFLDLRDRPAEERVVADTIWTWLSAGDFRADVGILFDPLSAVMLLVVSGVGFLIHVYSLGYMHDDAQERRFFAYMNLFVFSMLILVLAGNLVLLLVGWGMVGLSSYLLIGFWHHRPTAVAAAKKAFVMNAVGDVGLAIGTFLIFRELGTVDYREVFAGVPVLSDRGHLDWACGLLLIGALAKSAQIPLHTWLPDAMEGPTPVSALIHAATMVTAGVYLVARMNPLYAESGAISNLIVVIGATGLVMAGLIALFQHDIKRIIAYSTMSQIAYMFMGVGLGAYWAGMYHLVTHAFFKALLFMGAGIVIHALHDQQDIRHMGGLRRFLPRTTILMWIGSLALVGIVPFSGGWSKDAILSSGLEVGGAIGWVAWVAGIVGAFLTGLYSFRLLFLVFYGESSPYAADEAPKHTDHGEGPATMLWPVYALAALATVGGLLQIPGVTHYMTDFLEPITYGTGEMVEPSVAQEYLTTAAAVAAGLLGSVLAFRLWGRRPAVIPERASTGLAVLPERRFLWDELYDAILYRPAAAASNLIRRFVERPFFEAPLDAVGPASRLVARGFGVSQTGVVRLYALVFAVGVGALLLLFMVQA
ncbi:MAG: NADH-ubiquinone oxidoreductase chain L [uncultured Thermoleophilia bacterium]|uniref:NADH-ubiquinone oxidoreductase chain L n=1 Tax=uncultured Thermoleophilia bacterium TaxID=1497501 RepID=A0A6J4TTA4_9ACTN|nr:MAG: NADH-ubiquinone oxidoreductase chain L [uncultured Thermoleophilia bacterium]